MDQAEGAAVLERNVARVKQQVAEAVEEALRIGTASADRPVRIIAVSKYVDANWTKMLIDAGCRELGESRPQTLWQKFEAIADPKLDPPMATPADDSLCTAVRWHMIGHMQRNKVSRTLPMIDCLHSLDSLRLAESIHSEAIRQSRVCQALIEVNPTTDTTKTGLPESQVALLLEKLREMPGIKIAGLMAMSSLESTPQQSLREFQQVRELRDRLQHEFEGQFDLAELSMGMSGDFRQAILAGATMVRIGSLFWEGIL